MIGHKGCVAAGLNRSRTVAMPSLKLLASYLWLTEPLYVLSPFLLNRINVTKINFISLKLAS